MNNLPAVFLESLLRLGVNKKDRLLIAVSGGLDSVVLADCCAVNQLDFGIAHVNFQLRGGESIRDEEFVSRMALHYGKPFLVKKMETSAYAKTEKISIQVAARMLRYNWFKTMIGNGPQQYKFLVTAHHQDDHIETMLMHFFRGTGLMGLTGIPEKNEHIIRPLLSFSKNQLKEFAAYKNLTWVEDSSNVSSDYTRNYFRNQLIPSLTTIFPELHQNLVNNLERFSESAILYRQAIVLHKKKLLKNTGSEIHIPILLLKKVVPIKTILFEILKDFHFSPAQTDDVIRLLDSSNGKYISSATHRIIKNRRWLIIAAHEAEVPVHIIIEKNQSEIFYPEGEIHIRLINAVETGAHVSVTPGTEYLDADKIQFPLMLRKWQPGDYFYPLGMKKKKKLARFFIDQKLSKTAKEKIWVILTDSQVICVVGHRIDERFRVKPSTSKMMLIRNADSSIHS